LNVLLSNYIENEAWKLKNRSYNHIACRLTIFLFEQIYWSQNMLKTKSGVKVTTTTTTFYNLPMYLPLLGFLFLHRASSYYLVPLTATCKTSFSISFRAGLVVTIWPHSQLVLICGIFLNWVFFWRGRGKNSTED
jgi:hypothetical protein